jgi:hypothetical protein
VAVGGGRSRLGRHVRGCGVSATWRRGSWARHPSNPSHPPPLAVGLPSRSLTLPPGQPSRPHPRFKPLARRLNRDPRCGHCLAAALTAPTQRRRCRLLLRFLSTQAHPPCLASPSRRAAFGITAGEKRFDVGQPGLVLVCKNESSSCSTTFCLSRGSRCRACSRSSMIEGGPGFRLAAAGAAAPTSCETGTWRTSASLAICSGFNETASRSQAAKAGCLMPGEEFADKFY